MVTDTHNHHVFKGDSQQDRICSHAQLRDRSVTVNCSVFLSFRSSFVPEYDIRHLSIRARDGMTHPGHEGDCLLMLSLGKRRGVSERQLHGISVKDPESRKRDTPVLGAVAGVLN